MGSLREECGVFGIYNKEKIKVAEEVYLGLYSLQHRGQESCGIAVNTDGVFTYHKNEGIVPEVFDAEILENLPIGQMAIGHVRYSKHEQKGIHNAQPMVIKHVKGHLALAHNGALVNGYDLRREMEMEGVVFHTNNDTEVMAYKIAKERLSTNSVEEALEKVMYDLKGAYSLLLMSPRKMIAARDPEGFRPLSIGKLGESYVIASETCALDSVGATFIRDVNPGEIVIIENNEIRSIETHCGKKGHLCVFEFVYFARPDSVIAGSSVHEARKKAGEFLSKSFPVEADVVIGVPDSGLDAAIGYANHSGIPYGVGLIKNRYVARTFIQPSQSQRERSVKIKLNAISSTVKGKRVVLIDDSIVRGTTSAKLIKLIKDAGAVEVHLRSAAPPFKNPCFFGTDVDSKENLIACRLTQEEIRVQIGADSLGFLDVEDCKKMAENSDCGFCVGCFTGEYPIDVSPALKKDKYKEPIKI